MTALSVIGAIALILAMLAFAFALMTYCVDVVYDWHQRAVNRAVEIELRRRGKWMGDLAAWFHNVDHAAAWMAIADDMARGHWPRVQAVRDSGIPHHRAELLLHRQAPRKEAHDAQAL